MSGVDLTYIVDETARKFDIYHEKLPDLAPNGIDAWNTQLGGVRKNLLYMTDDASVLLTPRRDTDPTVLFVLTPTEILPASDETWSGRLVFLRTEEPLSAVLDRIRDIFDEYDAWHSDCVDIILRGKSISDLLERSAFLLDNPIALFEASGVLICKAGDFRNRIEGTLWEEVLQSGFLPVEHVMPGEFDSVFKKFAEGERIVSGHFSKDPAHQFMCLPVTADHRVIGGLSCIDINSPFTEGQKKILLTIRELVSGAFRQTDGVNILANEEHSCPKHLLYGLPANAISVASYLKARKWSSHEIWRLYSFPVCPPDGGPSEISSYVNKLSGVLIRSPIFLFENELIAIVRTKDFDPGQAESREKLEKTAESISLRCYVSEPFSDFPLLSAFHGQCSLLRKIDAEAGSVLLFSEQYMHILTGILREHGNIEGFCHPVIFALANDEKGSGRVLVRNLKTYLLNGRNIAETCRTLNIHRNTLIYRLQKLESLLQLSLNYADENTLCYLTMSCLLCTPKS